MDVSKLSLHIFNALNNGVIEELAQKNGLVVEWVDVLPQGGVIIKTPKGVHRFVYQEGK